MVADLRRNRVSMVFQHYGLLPHRNVLDNIAFGLEVRGVDQAERQERAAYMLEKVGLKGWEYAATSELSGGMQQRVGLARALTGDPEVLLMDEPFSGLDPLIRAQMREELAALQEELKKTIVFITHDLDEAITVGDRIAIMRDGQIIQLGTPEDIVANPVDDFVAEFTRGISKTRVLPVDRIMQPPCYVVSQQDTCSDVISVMETSNHPYAFIVDDNHECVGIATKEQIASGTASSAAPDSLNGESSLQEIDAHQPQTVATGTVIEQALPLILGHDFPIPVAGYNGELLGMVCQPDILEVVARSVQESQSPVSTGTSANADRA
jgi:glycine betaine/proline transport system ATP-binding protein